MYTIKRAAEHVGVSDSTLRAWERRYGLDLAQRSPAGYRLYDDAAVRMLRLTQELVTDGWPVREAAEEVRRRLDRPARMLPDPDPTVFVHLASEYDVPGLTAVLDRHFETTAFETLADEWLLPALRELGHAWDAGRITVAGEHMVAHGVARRLSAEYDAAASRADGPRVVIGLPPGARHDLGLLAFATAARRAGLDTLFLGSDVPVEAWVAAIAEPRTRAAVLAVPTPWDVARLGNTVSALAAASPDLLIAVGGAHQDQAPADCLRLGHQIGPAAALLAQTLQSTEK